ncbi:MAG: prepilin-type N-terminal cleavage/methylation domain-containing protein [Candidatus Staskawiczbacteria bacterium]|nr:prepilin-type N-terminal cleavage/methylation domain-containing protein [Candidatus Staskawiczbacteria bacterium]
MENKGFTLIEVLITTAIFAVLIFVVSAMLNDIYVNSNQQLSSMSNIDQARAAATAFTNEIRNATTGVDGSYPLNQATDGQIIFYSNFGTNNSAVQRIRYYVLGDILYKGVVLPTGSPLAYNLSSELISPAITGISNQGSPAFYYYDGNYSGTGSALTQPVNINQVRFVKINLMVKNQITPTDSSVFPVSAGAAIRSVKDNLGN